MESTAKIIRLYTPSVPVLGVIRGSHPTDHQEPARSQKKWHPARGHKPGGKPPFTLFYCYSALASLQQNDAHSP